MFDEDNNETKLCIEIHKWIMENLNDRAGDNDINRASSAPSCVRKRWYKRNRFDAEPNNPRDFIKFGFGDLTEIWMKDLIKKACVGENKTYSEVDFGAVIGSIKAQKREFEDYAQEPLTIQIGDLKVSGHADGWGKRNSDGKWELIEIKSSASRGFDKFKKGETPDYIRQVHALMLSDKAKKLGVTEARFFYMNKDTSHIFDRVYHFDEHVATQVKAEYLEAMGEKIPDRPFGFKEETYYKKPTGRMILEYPCTYCEYKQACFKDKIQMEFTKSGSPVWTQKR